jgi:hypothetical protein
MGSGMLALPEGNRRYLIYSMDYKIRQARLSKIFQQDLQATRND